MCVCVCVYERIARALISALNEAAYHRGRALNVATMFEIDNVIDPAETRNILIAALQSSVKMGKDKHYSVREKKKRTVDSW